mmetsp:Transcript_47528/g.147147  ORF Transcript_47528/g.147147 Transcript_47528/m.147147 type:complete len:80 (-) Transcript_47528:34-273(-)
MTEMLHIDMHTGESFRALVRVCVCGQQRVLVLASVQVRVPSSLDKVPQPLPRFMHLYFPALSRNASWLMCVSHNFRGFA